MNKYTQFQVAQSMPIAAANEGGGAAGIGVGLGAGLVMAQSMMNAVRPPRGSSSGGSRGRWRSGSRTSSRSGGTRYRHEVLHQLRQTDSAGLEVLPGVRRRSAVRNDERPGVDCGGARLRSCGVDEHGPPRRTVPALIVALDLHPLGKSNWHQFPGTGGITGVTLLTESHLACHTFPEYGSLCLNIFCCRPRPGTDFEALLKKEFGAARVSVRQVERPYQT